jgi:hypothetical protein
VFMPDHVHLLVYPRATTYLCSCQLRSLEDFG